MSNKLSKVVMFFRSYFFSEDAGLFGHGKHRKHFDDANTKGSNSIELKADSFFRMQRLRILHLRYVRIHESIGCLEGLVYLNMRDCKNLKKLPGSFCLLKSLEKLIISGCSKLVTTVIELGKLESLTTLQADGMNFGQLVAVGENNKLTFLCRWKFGKYLQTGDQINVSLPCWSKTFKMKEFGVTLAYDNLEPD
ncbi:hypothetical protein P3S68_019637 [Capsicum galapagoense]